MSLRVEAGFQHLKDAFAQILARDVEFPPGVMVTVLDAKVTANTSHAKIILSVFPLSAERDARKTLRDFDREIKQGLTERLRLRRVPQLHYVFDEIGAYVSEIDKTIHELKEKGEIN